MPWHIIDGGDFHASRLVLQMKLPEGFNTCIKHVDNYNGLVWIVKYMYYTSFVYDGRLYGRWLLPLNHASSRPLSSARKTALCVPEEAVWDG